MSRPCKGGRCKWVAQDDTTDVCILCGDVYPCPWECSCCEDKRGRAPNCVVCLKPVPLAERFHLSGSKGWVAVHRSCYVEDASITDTSITSPVDKMIVWNESVGTRVKIVDTVYEQYKKHYGDLVDDLEVEKGVDENRVIVRWIGMVPIRHLQTK